MKNNQRGNAVLVIIILVAFIILAILVWNSRKDSIKSGSTENMNNSAMPANNNNGMDASVGSSTDFSGVDQNINQLDQDQADIEASMNDKPVEQDY